MDKDDCQVDVTKIESEQHQGEIKTESDHGTADCESQLMITDVRTVLPGEDNCSEMKSNVPPEKVTSDFLHDHEQDTLVNRTKALPNHLKSHVEKKPHKCKACGKYFADEYHLKTHFWIHTGEKPYACNICEKSFIQRSNLTRHNRIHTGEKPYKCQVCGCSFTTCSNLAQHNRIHTGDKPYKCNICQQSLLKAVALQSTEGYTLA